MNIKRIASFIAVWLILCGATYSLTLLKKGHFFDYSFFVGLIGVVLIKFSSSSGGFTSDNLDMHLQSQTGMRQDRQSKSFDPPACFMQQLSTLCFHLV
ncbi:hypothetical protein [Pseudobacillus wudalianchiensis]|uniref:Uncharacterized protein n=1 Tax=Pseudobacillus wudalianchiensis TaxID=1743143 RepID=A0A1B9B8H0_9BACI|nr:hypothetical protein [Bacillus wudalianchiensis]OCA92363.1 hypothetical protein A8F95_01205 [Bacillus wudalianchiensis]